jgi:hypothetical protein
MRFSGQPDSSNMNSWTRIKVVKVKKANNTNYNRHNSTASQNVTTKYVNSFRFLLTGHFRQVSTFVPDGKDIFAILMYIFIQDKWPLCSDHNQTSHMKGYWRICSLRTVSSIFSAMEVIEIDGLKSNS